jgi:S1-C subfamily serine protease
LEYKEHDMQYRVRTLIAVLGMILASCGVIGGQDTPKSQGAVQETLSGLVGANTREDNPRNENTQDDGNSSMPTSNDDNVSKPTSNDDNVSKPASNDDNVSKPASNDDVKIADIIAATVRIGILDASWNEVGHGSGAIIDSRGLILTNFHVIGDNETGQYYNADGISYIYVTLNPRDPPKAQFISQVVDADPGKDLAVLRVIATTNGEPPADCLTLPTVQIAEESQVEIGDELTSVGYAGVGGETVSIASGQVVGFEEFSMSSLSSRSYEAIKYDASDSRGQSGGPIVNQRNQQVAVVFAGMSDQGDSLGYARPVSLASDLISSAKLVRIPGCNGAAAATLIGPASDPGTASNQSNANTNTTTEATVYDVEGRILDYLTEQPIANAFVVLLQPGYTWADVDYDRFDEYIWVYGETDASGVYVLSVTEEMAATAVGVGIFADGYYAIKDDAYAYIEMFDENAGAWQDLYLEAIPQ